jgi:single-strand DNA-binding protein
MAGNYNKVLLLGNLTRDIELRHTPNNQAVANIGIAVNRRYRGSDNELKEDTTFVDCEAWGKTAETMSRYLNKGRPVFIEGRLRLDQWQDKEGNNRSKLKVVVETFQFVDSGGGGGGGGGSGGGAGRRDDSAAAPTVDDDDIPF